jgi:hypothetical protein
VTAPKPVRLNYEALHRIRLAAGSFPADQNASELERQLSKAVYDYRQLSTRNINAQQARLKAVRRHASKLASLLREDEEHGGIDWYSQWPKDWPPPSKVAEEIQRRIEESAVLKTSAQKIIGEIIPGSPLEWLFGTKLPEVFERFFQQGVTRYEKGDYVRFAHQVCEEFKLGKVKSATIIRALTSAGSDRRRRRQGGQK